MAVYSMTGYATLTSGPAPADAPPAPTLGLEIRSVNSRFLDLTFKLSDELRGAELACVSCWSRTAARQSRSACLAERQEGGIKPPPLIS